MRFDHLGVVVPTELETITYGAVGYANGAADSLDPGLL
jgi:hypothetical protein